MNDKLKMCAVIRLAIIALLFVLTLPMSALGQDKPPKIVDIIVLGNKGLNVDSIILQSGLKVGDDLTQASLDAAKRSLVLSQSFDPDSKDPLDGVSIEASISEDRTTAKVVIKVKENGIVKEITIEGIAPPFKVEEILALFQTKRDRVLNLGTLRADSERVAKFYADRGYNAFISQDIKFEDGVLHIPIVVSRVNEIIINGPHKTKRFVITREMKTKVGMPFNSLVLEKDINRIFNTDLFDNVERGFRYPEPGKLDIVLNVQEKRTGTVSFGVGYNNRQKLVGRAEIGENNLFGRGQKANILWLTGGPANRTSIELGFTEPWIDNKNTSLSVNAYDRTVYLFERDINSTTGGNVNGSDYFEVHTGGQVTLSRPFRDTYRVFAGIRHDQVRVPNITLNPNDSAILQNGSVSALNLRLTHNTRYVHLDPATGGYDMYSLDVGFADLKPVTGNIVNSPVTGQANFQKLQVDVRRYFSLRGPRKTVKDRKPIIATRLVLGTSGGTLPFWEQYFVGGAETLRGFREIRFWGQHMFLGTVEYRAPLANQLTGVVFTDVGSAWGGPYRNVAISGFNQSGSPSPQVGFGFGIRVVTPIGPIRIDQGFSRDGTRTHFSIGHVF